MQLTESEVLSNTWLFVIDFDMTNGVVFEEDPAVMTQVQDLVNAFRLSAEPGNWGSGFMVSVTAEGTPMPIVDNETTTTAPGTISTSTTAISDNNSSTIPEALSFSMISPDHRRGQ